MTERPKPPVDVLDRVDRAVARTEGALLVAVVLVMIVLATVQLVLRKLFDFSFEWADIVVRQMVLWLAFIGGSLATHEGRHIAIDAVSRLLPARRAASVRALTSVGAVVVACVLVYASFQFLKNEMSAGSKVFGDVPSWSFEAIIPLAFVTITFHFLVAARKDVLIAMGRRAPSPPEAEAGIPGS